MSTVTHRSNLTYKRMLLVDHLYLLPPVLWKVEAYFKINIRATDVFPMPGAQEATARCMILRK